VSSEPFGTRGRGRLPLKVDPVLGSLILLLPIVWLGFWGQVGGRFISAANLQAMAFQLPALGIPPHATPARRWSGTTDADHGVTALLDEFSERGANETAGSGDGDQATRVPCITGGLTAADPPPVSPDADW